LAKAKVIAEIPKSKADEPEYFINLGPLRVEDYFIPQENPSGNRNRSDCKPIHASPSVAIQMDAENWIV
jgi:hypothetical protein